MGDVFGFEPIPRKRWLIIHSADERAEHTVINRVYILDTQATLAFGTGYSLPGDNM